MFNTEKFIAQVGRHPAVWDTSCDAYKDRERKKRDWDDICKEMIRHWDSFPPRKKHEHALILQKKWKNIRDRYIKDSKLVRSGPSASKSRQYVFYDNLTFLSPIFGQGYSDCDSTEGNQDYYGEEEEIPIRRKAPTNTTVKTKKRIEYNNFDVIERKSEKKCSANYEEIFRELMSKRQIIDEDDDSMFLLSLRSLMQQMTPENRIKTRIEMMQVIQKNLQSPDYEAARSSSPDFDTVASPTTSLKYNDKHIDGLDNKNDILIKDVLTCTVAPSISNTYRN